MVSTVRRGWPISMTVFSVSVAVGHACTQAPHDTHSLSKKLPLKPAATREPNPRPSMVSANVPCTCSHARTQREHTMHFEESNVKYGLLVSCCRPKWLSPAYPYRTSRRPTAPAMSCSSQSPLAAQVRQSSGWSLMYSSITPRRRRSSFGD